MASRTAVLFAAGVLSSGAAASVSTSWPKDCRPRFAAPPAPLHATDLNGGSISAACFNATKAAFKDEYSHHVFIIGDWGGVQPGPGQAPIPADHRSPMFASHHRKFVGGADECAQQKVAVQMAQRARINVHPDYILNVGDNFYWGGVKAHCGHAPHNHIATGQWETVFESIYKGPGIDNKQWLGVLGNHDYGGFKFTSGWDQAIGYTWANGDRSRWMTPAQYWSTTAWYPDFAVDYFFTDSNVFNALDPRMDPGHNLCSVMHNPKWTASCGPQGPESVWDCPGWFGKLWAAQIEWLDVELAKSKAEWQIVVTHFPPTWGQAEWTYLSKKHGIDLIIAGHQHKQEVHYKEPALLGDTAWVVSGGGGGITSEGSPDKDGYDDMYGFMDMTLSKESILVESISHGGILRISMKVHQRFPSDESLPLMPYETKEGAIAEVNEYVDFKHQTERFVDGKWVPVSNKSSDDENSHNSTNVTKAGRSEGLKNHTSHTSEDKHVKENEKTTPKAHHQDQNARKEDEKEPKAHHQENHSSVVCDESLHGFINGANYRGCQTTTRTGKTCQQWEKQSPHTHTCSPLSFPGKGLEDNNYCRNPDLGVAIWCYTTDPAARWDYCDPVKVHKQPEKAPKSRDVDQGAKKAPRDERNKSKDEDDESEDEETHTDDDHSFSISIDDATDDDKKTTRRDHSFSVSLNDEAPKSTSSTATATTTTTPATTTTVTTTKLAKTVKTTSTRSEDGFGLKDVIVANSYHLENIGIPDGTLGRVIRDYGTGYVSISWVVKGVSRTTNTKTEWIKKAPHAQAEIAREADRKQELKLKAKEEAHVRKLQAVSEDDIHAIDEKRERYV